MNKYVAYMVASVVTILVPLIGLLYGYWDMKQPRTGAVGDGTVPGPTTVQLILMIGTILVGILNLIVSISTYSRQNKIKLTQNKKNDEENLKSK
ncbi:hypothetical protein [Paenibacillus herberti]|uniref:hypothetical protein n=1 Tax=Paenibacillus herberti TaxID=1619309 RepID=UPI001595E447|nr:hypothetical protein [Paenibacillus herberti]